MGNAHVSLEDAETNELRKKNAQDPSNSNNSSHSLTSQSLAPSRMVRNATHTTNTTYDDTASLSTCATSSGLHKILSHDNSQHEEQHQNQAQRKLKIQRKLKQQQAKTSHLARLDKKSLQCIGERSSGKDSSRRTGPLDQQEPQVVNVMYASPRRNHPSPPINTSQTHPQAPAGRITEQDQWQSAWEEDTESSEDEDGNGKVSIPKLLARRNKSDSVLSHKIDLALESGKNGVKWDKNGYEKPNIMMFFPLLRVLGKGSFGKVVLVQKRTGKETGGLFAMKILRKTHLLQRGQIERTRTERRVLAMVDHPFIMKLHFAFQSTAKLFLVLDYCAGGELFFHLSRHRRFSEKWTRFYAAELLLALGHLHAHGIIYRDLKPENVLLDSDGHVKLGDFGLAKTGIEHPFRGAVSRVGTPEYMAPEILQQKGHGFCVDYWGLGMLTYEMMTGLPPWYTTDRQKLFKRLNHASLEIPSSFSPHAATFVTALLQRDPRRRLGVRGNQTAVNHDFFRKLDFKAVLARQIEAPILPCEGWKAPEPVEKNSKGKKSIIRGMFSGGNSNKSNTTIGQLPADELDAATVNFDKQFTRMALSSVSGNGDDHSDNDLSQELNENTFVGFTFDDDVDFRVPHI